jgi:NMD protein affecting ribosome stability and mRNA decay
VKTKGFWVVKTSAGGYWSSGCFDPQLRKAHVYTWKEKAEEAIETFIRRKYLPSEITYEVIAVAEPRELKDTEAEWEAEFDCCSNCGRSALNDYRGNPVLSRFCPHCGKRMTNSTMPEDD